MLILQQPGWEGGTGTVGLATNVVIPLGGDSARKGRSSSTGVEVKEEPGTEKDRERHRER